MVHGATLRVGLWPNWESLISSAYKGDTIGEIWPLCACVLTLDKFSVVTTVESISFLYVVVVVVTRHYNRH